MSDSLWPHGLYSPWTSPGQNTGVGSLSLLQRIFPTQGSNPGLPHCRQILYQQSHKGSPTLEERDTKMRKQSFQQKCRWWWFLQRERITPMPVSSGFTSLNTWYLPTLHMLLTDSKPSQQKGAFWPLFGAGRLQMHHSKRLLPCQCQLSKPQGEYWVYIVQRQTESARRCHNTCWNPPTGASKLHACLT